MAEKDPDIENARRLAEMQEARAARGALLREMYPEFFRSDMAVDQPLYPVEDREAAIEAGRSFLLNEENPVRRGLAAELLAAGVPIGALEDAVSLAEMTPLGAPISGVDFIQSGRGAVDAALSGDPAGAAIGAGEALLSGIGAVGVASPLVPVARSAARATDDVVDTARAAIDNAQVMQAQNFALKNAPLGTTGRDAVGKRMYLPSGVEDTLMSMNPTDDQRRLFLDNIEMSRDMALMGETDDEILELTGVLRLPIRNAEGEFEGVREILMTDDNTSVFSRLRNVDQPDVELVPQSTFDNPNTRGEFRDGRVLVSEELDMPQAMQTAQHELGHFDYATGTGNSFLERSEVGSDPQLELALLRDRVQSYRQQLRDPSKRDQWPEIQDKLKRALATETAFTNYQNNPGEIAARLISDDLYTTAMLSPTEVLNPYINSNQSPVQRGIGALRAYLRPDLNAPDFVYGLLDEDAKTPEFVRRRLESVLQEPPIRMVPLDTSKGRVTDPAYKFFGRSSFLPDNSVLYSTPLPDDEVPF